MNVLMFSKALVRPEVVTPSKVKSPKTEDVLPQGTGKFDTWMSVVETSMCLCTFPKHSIE